jgi:hypothetical protein
MIGSKATTKWWIHIFSASKVSPPTESELKSLLYCVLLKNRTSVTSAEEKKRGGAVILRQNSSTEEQNTISF